MSTILRIFSASDLSWLRIVHDVEVNKCLRPMNSRSPAFFFFFFFFVCCSSDDTLWHHMDYRRNNQGGGGGGPDRRGGYGIENITDNIQRRMGMTRVASIPFFRKCARSPRTWCLTLAPSFFCWCFVQLLGGGGGGGGGRQYDRNDRYDKGKTAKTTFEVSTGDALHGPED